MQPQTHPSHMLTQSRVLLRHALSALMAASTGLGMSCALACSAAQGPGAVPVVRPVCMTLSVQQGERSTVG